MGKNVVQIFKNCGLSIIGKTNLKIVDNLNVILDLQNNGYKRHRKPNNLLVYIHKHSNHPTTILNELTKSIAKRISYLSSSENIFHNAITVYKEAIRKRDFTFDLVSTPKQLDPNNNNKENKKQGCMIQSYDSILFSKSAKSNIGKKLHNLIKKYFPKTNELHKIFNIEHH